MGRLGLPPGHGEPDLARAAGQNARWASLTLGGESPLCGEPPISQAIAPPTSAPPLFVCVDDRLSVPL